MRFGKGFTLLELLMVVIIIAILATIALPGFIQAAERSRMSEALQILGTIRGAEHRYRAEVATGLYTNVIANLDVSVPAMTSWTVPTLTVAAGPVGKAETKRSGGTYVNQIVGMQFGTGTICGTFVPGGGTLPVCLATGD